MKLLVLDGNTDLSQTESRSFSQAALNDEFDVVLSINGHSPTLVRQPVDAKVDLSQHHCDSLVIKLLRQWYCKMESQLKPLGFHQVCELPLWELVKVSIFYHLRNQVYPLWVAHQIIDRFQITDTRVVHDSQDPLSSCASAIISLCAQMGIACQRASPRDTHQKRDLKVAAQKYKAAVDDRIAHEANRLRKILPTRRQYKSGGAIFSAYYPNNAWQLLAVRDQLPEIHRQYSRMLAGSSLVNQTLRHLDPDAQYLHNFSNHSLVGRARKLSKEFHRLVVTRACQDPDADTFTACVEGLALQWVCRNYGHVVWSVFSNVEAVKQLRPTAIVTTTQWTIEAKSQMMVAQKLFHIPTVWVQHGLADFTPLTGPMYFDLLLVWGEKDKAQWQSMGIPGERVNVAGGVSFDALVELGRSEQNTKRYLGLPSSFLVTFTTQPAGGELDQGEHDQTLTWVVEAARELRDVTFVIKPHPVEKESYYRSRLDWLKLPNLMIVKSINTDRLIAASDLLVTLYSTTGMTAIALGKPLITLMANPGLERSPYEKEGVALPAHDTAELMEHIRLVRSHKYDSSESAKKNANFVRNYMFNIDGNAAKRCASAVSCLLETTV